MKGIPHIQPFTLATVVFYSVDLKNSSVVCMSIEFLLLSKLWGSICRLFLKIDVVLIAA
jgi:hypothetical protein